jgi:hypothetical protein
MHGEGVRHRLLASSGDALPNDPMVIPLAAHACPIEVPEDGSERAQPMHSEDQVVALQLNHEEVKDEFLLVDEDARGAADTCTRYPVPVCNGHMEAGQRV